jgi:hypothetical protein
VKEINSLIDATNSIVRDLAKEGIHLPTLTPLELGEDLPSIFTALKWGRSMLVTIVELLKELRKCRENQDDPGMPGIQPLN